MGVIFEKRIDDDRLAGRIAESIGDHISGALAEEPPPENMRAGRAEEITKRAANAATAVAVAPPTTGSIRWKPFAVAVGLFFVLLAIAIFLDWRNVVDDPKVYSGMATTVLGVVIGFFGGDAAGTASS